MKNKFRKFMAYLLVLMLMSSDIAVLAESMIKTLTLPAALQIIEEEAFYSNTSIEKVVVPDGTTEIRSRAFADSSLTEIELPDTLTFIADDAFENCTDFDIIAEEGSYAYEWAVDMGYINPPVVVTGTCGASIQWRLDGRGLLTISGEGSMNDYVSGRSPWYSYKDSIRAVAIENGVTRIGENTFYKCSSLSSVTIADSIVSIGKFAFYSCTSLTQVELPESLTDLAQQSFQSCSGLTSISVPDGIRALRAGIFQNCTSLREVKLPAKLEAIAEYAFYKCENLTKIDFPESVVSIGDYAFAYCPVEEIAFPSALRTLGQSCFKECRNLQNVTMKDGITSLDFYTFMNCTSLKTINLPCSITVMRYSFQGCTNLIATVEKDSYAHEWCVKNDVNYVLVDSVPTATPTATPVPTPTPTPAPEPTVDPETDFECSHTWTGDCGEYSCEMIVGNEQQHETISVSWKECRSCGEVVGEKTEVRRYEDHSFDDSGWCGYCGYQMNDQPACNHSDTGRLQMGQTIYNQIDGDDEKHQVEKHYSVICDTCGETIDSDLEELTTEEHSFDQAGLCTKCQYQMEIECDHADTSRIQVGNPSYKQVASNDEIHQIITYYVEKCNICGAIVEDGISETTSEEHTFDTEGTCEFCGYEKCLHAETIKEYVKTTYAQISMNDAQHQVTNYYKLICDNCGEITDSNYTENLKGNHTFDNANKCTLCGYVKPQEVVELVKPVIIHPALSNDSQDFPDDFDFPAYSVDDMTIVWGTVESAVKYTVRLDEYEGDDEEWDEIIDEAETRDTEFIIPEDELYEGGLFRVRVKAYSADGASKSSGAYYFRVGSPNFIGVNREEIKMDYEGDYNYIDVYTGQNWRATISDRSWITLTDYRGKNEISSGFATYEDLRVEVTENEDDFPRVGTITFRNDSGRTAVVTVVQEGNGSANEGKLKITTPTSGDTVEYDWFDVKWTDYNNTTEYYTVELLNVTTDRVMYFQDMTLDKKQRIYEDDLDEGHSYRITVTAYNYMDVEVDQAIIVIRVEGEYSDEDYDDDEVIETPEVPEGSTKLELTGITNNSKVDLKNINLSWKEVIGRDYYAVALRDITPDAGNKLVINETTENLKYTIPSSKLVYGHTYRLWVAAHKNGITDAITGVQVEFTVENAPLKWTADLSGESTIVVNVLEGTPDANTPYLFIAEDSDGLHYPGNSTPNIAAGATSATFKIKDLQMKRAKAYDLYVLPAGVSLTDGNRSQYRLEEKIVVPLWSGNMIYNVYSGNTDVTGTKKLYKDEDIKVVWEASYGVYNVEVNATLNGETLAGFPIPYTDPAVIDRDKPVTTTIDSSVLENAKAGDKLVISVTVTPSAEAQSLLAGANCNTTAYKEWTGTFVERLNVTSAAIETKQVRQSDVLSTQVTVTGLIIMPDGYGVDDFKYVGIQYALAESYDAATDTGWKETLFASVSADGSIELTIKQLKPETEYVFRAVAYDTQQQKWLRGNAIFHQTPARTAYDDLISDESGPIGSIDGILPDDTLTLDPVEITYPANGDVVNTTDIVLKWNHVENAERYYIYVRDITAGEDKSKEDKYLLTPVGGVEIAFSDNAEDYAVRLIYMLDDNKQFEYGHTYNIAIKAESALYESSWGVAKIVIDKPYLPAPKMIAPISKDDNHYTDANDVLFQWTAVQGATQYKVYIKDVTNLSDTDRWSDNAGDEVVLDGYVYSDPDVVDGVISLNVGLLAKFKGGHTYKACVMASDGGIAYKDAMAPAFIFFVGNEANIISAFDVHTTQENKSLTAYMNSSVTARWAAPVDKSIVGYTLDGYLIELSTTENGVNQYASATVAVDATEFKIRLNEWSRVDGGIGIEETKKGEQSYLWSVTPIVKTPDGRTVYGHMSAFNLTVYAAKEVVAPKGLDVTSTWLSVQIWDTDTWWWVIDPNADDDITASWKAYEGNGHKLRLTWYKDGTNEYADRLGDYSVSKSATSYALEKDKLMGEGTYIAKLYAVFSESLYDGCVYTYVESEPVTKRFKVGEYSNAPEESEGNTEDPTKYAAVVAPVVGTEDDEGNIVDTWRWSENGSWASYQGSKGIEARDWHVGIDIGEADNEINPIADGTVIQSDWNNANGNTITIEHKILIDGNERTIYSFYAHMKNASKFEAGDEVTTSDVIGVVGSTGSSSLGDHLHLAIVTGAAPQADTVGYVYLKNFYSDFDGKTGSDFESLLQTYVNDGNIRKGPTSSDYDVVGIDSVTYGNKTFHNPWKFIGSNSNYRFVVTPHEDDNNNSAEEQNPSDHVIEFKDFTVGCSSTRAYMYAQAVAPESGTYTEFGLRLMDSQGKEIIERANASSSTSTSKTKTVWFDLLTNADIKLAPATQYKCQLYTVYNGNKYWSAEKTFETLPMTTIDHSISTSAMVANLQNCTNNSILPSDKKEAMVTIAKYMLDNGFDPAFVAGIIGNIRHEASFGIFESSAYSSNKPEYLTYMDNLYNYREKYSGKLIYNGISLSELDALMDTLSTDNYSKGKFGLGCVQWTGGRTSTLVDLYVKHAGASDTINFDQVVLAEEEMIYGELTGQEGFYNKKSVVTNWKTQNIADLYASDAAYDAGYRVCVYYEVPANYRLKGIERGETAYNLYLVMMGIK